MSQIFNLNQPVTGFRGLVARIDGDKSLKRKLMSLGIRQGQVSLKDAALHFDVEPEAIRGMLEFWVSKGKISKYRNQAACASGCVCSYQE